MVADRDSQSWLKSADSMQPSGAGESEIHLGLEPADDARDALARAA